MIWLGSRITVRDGGGLLWWEPPGAASSSWSAPLVKGPISCAQDDGLVELVWSSNSVVMHSQSPPVRGLEAAFVVDDISPEMELFSEIFCQMPADAGHSSTGKRKQRDATGSPSEVMRDVEYESAHSAAVTKREPSSTGKRRRAAQVQNLSERRRRDIINEKMRALQELIPHCNKYIETSCSYQNTKTLLHFYDLMVVIVPPNKTAANGPEKACTEQRGCLEKSPQKEGLHPTARDEPDKAGPARARASTCQTAGPEEKHRIMARPLPPPPPVPCSRRRSLHSPLPLRCPLSTPAHLFFWTITGSGELATWES